MTSVTAQPPSPTRSPRSRPSPAGENHTNEITPACLASSQAEKVIVVPPLSEMRDKSLDESGGTRTVIAVVTHGNRRSLFAKAADPDAPGRGVRGPRPRLAGGGGTQAPCAHPGPGAG